MRSCSLALPATSTTVHQNAVVAHDLARFSARGAEAHLVSNVVEARFQHLQQRFAGNAFLLRRALINIAELALEQAVDTAQLLLFAQLYAIAGKAAVLLTVLTRRIIAALNRTFIGEALIAFEEEFLALAAALTALCV
jgi:hypothetical protein